MNDKRYKIEVTEFCFEKRIKGKEWKQVTDGVLEGGGNYAYTPEIEKTVEVERTIFTQNTDDLDLVAVIKAVNGLGNG